MTEEAQIIYMKVTTGEITESIDVVGSLEAVPSITLAWESGGIISPFDLRDRRQGRKRSGPDDSGRQLACFLNTTGTMQVCLKRK